MNNFIHHCPGSLWKFLCWSVTQLYPVPRPRWRPLITYSLTAPIVRSGKFPSLRVCFLQIIFWVFDRSWTVKLALYSPRDEGAGVIGFSLPHSFLFAQICELLREESFRHVSQALSIRLIDKQAGPWHWTVSFVDAGILRMKPRESESLWLMVCSFWRMHCDFWQRKEGIQTKQGKEESVISYYQRTPWFLLPRIWL